MPNKLLFAVIASLVWPLLASAESLLLYKPPMSEAPKTRIGGGTRGLSAATPQVQVLAPAQLALTSQNQPVLYWYAAGAKPQSIQIKLTAEGFEQSLLDTNIPAPETSGLQTIRLADYNISLSNEQTYTWTVTALNDPTQPEKNLSASATLKFKAPETPLTSVEQQAQQGYWYDALQSLVEAHSPQVNDLLKQAGVHTPPL